MLFANLITSLETYLYELTMELLQGDQSLLLNVAKSEKFKARKLPIHFALQNDLKQYFLPLVTEINFHNLSDIEPLFRGALDVKIPLNDDVLQAIRVRHDIVHRDGFSKTGEPIIIDQRIIEKTAQSLSELVQTVDRQVIDRYAGLLNT
ncbi:MAG: hypothetical protein C1943_14050 [Halochromatium sp.]|nr:hypothetical protein [Halochromatium sp.]